MGDKKMLPAKETGGDASCAIKELQIGKLLRKANIRKNGRISACKASII